MLGKTEVPPSLGSCRVIVVFELNAQCLPLNLALSVTLRCINKWQCLYPSRWGSDSLKTIHSLGWLRELALLIDMVFWVFLCGWLVGFFSFPQYLCIRL